MFRVYFEFSSGFIDYATFDNYDDCFDYVKSLASSLDVTHFSSIVELEDDDESDN